VAAGSSQTVGARVEGEPLQSGVDDRTVLGRAAHHRRPHEKARLEGLGRGAVAVEVAAIVRVHEDVRAALQLGIDADRGLELEVSAAGYDGAVGLIAQQEICPGVRNCSNS
jgi:hypothetical protein